VVPHELAVVNAQASHLPPHLARYVVAQDVGAYTPLDHAVWRAIMRVNQAFFRDHAHPLYSAGLTKTGIPMEHIPHIADMNTCLAQFGWQAVAVSGFIPPSAFMEFQSMGILPIACDMRQPIHLCYTPAPDIVHEAAGHAPMLADPDYAAYLKHYGSVARKAIAAKHDDAVFWAIRRLSEVKESPTSTLAERNDVANQLEAAQALATFTSEAAQLARFYWWTVEYGLFGSVEDPKIYGAGLLSSVGESHSCLQPDVLKLPFSLACLDTPYDITRPQPQLYVTPDFKSLSDALETFAHTMAYQTGGLQGLNKAVQAQTVNTVVLDTGLQISGVLANVQTDSVGQPAYLQFQGPCQLATDDTELPGHGISAHAHGFGAPVGLLADGFSLAQATTADLAVLGLIPGQPATLTYASGVQVTGQVQQLTCHPKAAHIVLVQFLDCQVTVAGQTLFSSDWGVYDLACGAEVVSVFGGPADGTTYPDDWALYHGPGQAIAGQKSNFTDDEVPLYRLLQQLRQCRDDRPQATVDADALSALWQQIHELPSYLRVHPMVWIVLVELLELVLLGQTEQPNNLRLATLAQALDEALARHAQVFPEWAAPITQNRALLNQ
jgi:phenylalanine-4-hydroxylase